MRLNERFRGFLPVVLDVETGGVDPRKHALLEIAVVTLDWSEDRLYPQNSYSWAITPHPNSKIDSKSTALNGIDPFDPQRESQSEAICVRECFRIIRKLVTETHCQRAFLTGHNAHFDRQFLLAAKNRNSIGRDPFHPFTVIDTASLSALIYGHTVLQIACERAGINYDKDRAHSASYDAKVTAELFCKIVNTVNLPIVEQTAPS